MSRRTEQSVEEPTVEELTVPGPTPVPESAPPETPVPVEPVASIFNTIFAPAAAATNTNRTDLPPLKPYNARSLWVNPTSGEMMFWDYQIGKTGAGLNSAIDRIIDNIAKPTAQGRTANKGFGPLEGCDFLGLMLVPIG